MEESTRVEREITTGSAPLVDALEPLPGLSFAPLTFNASKFMSFVSDEDLSDAEAEQLLRTYWEVAVAFVDAKFCPRRPQAIVDGLPAPPVSQVQESAAVISSSTSISTTNDEADAAREKREAVVEEDS